METVGRFIKLKDREETSRVRYVPVRNDERILGFRSKGLDW